MVSSKDIVDVLLIGSGASGGPFAWHLSSLPGIKIMCLEQGEWVGKSANVQSEPDAQLQRLIAPVPPQQGIRQFVNGYPYDFTNSYWQPVLGNNVGGATVHYSAVWQRLHPSDFLARTLDGVADDWPIRYADLAPYYDIIDNWVGVAGVAGNPAFPARKVNFMPPPQLSKGAERLVAGFKRLGWHWWPVSRAVITQPHHGRKPCPTNCAACDSGCPREAKNSSDVTFWPEAIKNGVALKTRARVREITVNKQGLADGALYYDADGKLVEQKARIVVVACNGIGTPRVLLNSKSNRFPHGLANSSGLVGKNLMGHPSTGVAGTFDNVGASPNEQSSLGIESHQFYEGNTMHGFTRGGWILMGPYGPPVSMALGEGHEPQATIVPAALRSDRPSGMVRWGQLHHAAYQEQASRTVRASVFADELPSEENRVELHPTLTDEVGIPGVKLIYKRSENTEKIFAYGIARMTEAMEAAGARSVTSSLGTAAPGHYLGTARMGTDPKRSVVDGWGRAHDVKNLFIIDGSVFTTGAPVVPTASIHAIALRIADYIKTNSRNILT